MSSRNIPLAWIVNKEGEGFYVYLVPEDKRKYHDLYLLKIRGSIKKNKLDIYFREREIIDLIAVLASGMSEKRLKEYRRKYNKRDR